MGAAHPVGILHHKFSHSEAGHEVELPESADINPPWVTLPTGGLGFYLTSSWPQRNIIPVGCISLSIVGCFLLTLFRIRKSENKGFKARALMILGLLNRE